MAELGLNYTTMQECITNMQELSANYPAAVRPLATGEGQSIEEIEKLADLYVSFYEAVEELAEETAKYLSNIVTEFEEIDQNYCRSEEEDCGNQ